ncbi:MAG: ATP-binding protein [Arenimonas sp.]
MSQNHPIFIPSGYQIGTKPTERFANSILFNYGQDHHGIVAHGPGRIGKTTGMKYLTLHAKDWLGDKGVAARLNMPKGNRHSDSSFFETFGGALKLSEPTRPKDKKRIHRVSSYILSRCGAARVRLMVLFIDNAQRISLDELEYLVDLDDMVEEEGVRLFIVFMRQSDATGVETDATMVQYPSHVLGRFLMDDHEFTCLLGLADVIHALSRYDSAAFWPDLETSFSCYFTRGAFLEGWRLEAEAPLIIRTVNSVREENGLHPSDQFPMKTFTGMVKFLLCDVADKDRVFSGFTEVQIRKALAACGYLKLEQVRAGLIQDLGQTEYA